MAEARKIRQKFLDSVLSLPDPMGADLGSWLAHCEIEVVWLVGDAIFHSPSPFYMFDTVQGVCDAAVLQLDVVAYRDATLEVYRRSWRRSRQRIPLVQARRR